jgi:hypothetical protein
MAALVFHSSPFRGTLEAFARRQRANHSIEGRQR